MNKLKNCPAIGPELLSEHSKGQKGNEAAFSPIQEHKFSCMYPENLM